MLVWLTKKYLIQFYSGFNILYYLTFRAILSLLTALLLSLYIGSTIICWLTKLQVKQIIRKNGPQSHFRKCNTPTMGGIMMLISIILSILIWSHLLNPYIWYVLFILISYGIIGFIDDYKKIVCQNTSGITAMWKYIWQSIIALSVALVIFLTSHDISETKLIIPFLKNVTPQLGIWYIVLTYFVIVGTSNAVNITDGLDGLAIVPTIFVASGLALTAWTVGNINFANYLHIPYIRYASELVIVCSAIVGSGLGFLWFNTYPAQIFMGDVGSLALGGSLGIISVLLRQECLLFIMGGVFVIETLSVILQVISFKLFGQRIFKMAPIHHHFELKGWPEPRVIVRFWIIALIFIFIGLVTLKVR